MGDLGASSVRFWVKDVDSLRNLSAMVLPGHQRDVLPGLGRKSQGQRLGLECRRKAQISDLLPKRSHLTRSS